jgi:hypothetical protein
MPVPSYNLAEAVALACPGAKFSLNPETYAGLTMLDGTPKPSEAAIEAAWANRPIPPLTTVVTMAALRQALGRDVCLQIGAWIGQITDTETKFQAQTWWEFAPTVRRSHPVVEQFRVALGKTNSEVDFWFTKASEIDNM